VTPSIARWWVIGAAALFSTGGTAIKATTLTGWQVAGARSLVAAVVLLVVMPGARRGWDRKTAAVAVAYAATLTLFVLANKLTTAVHTIFLQSTSPIYILAVSPWLLGEPRRREDLAVLAVIAAGMGLILSGSDAATSLATDPALGNLLAAGSGVAWAGTVMGLRYLSRDPDRPDAGGAAAALGNLLTAAVCLPMMLPMGAVSAADVAVIGWLGVFQIGGAYFLLTRAMPHVPALTASLLLFVEPVLSGVWAWSVHGEVPGPAALVGSGLVLAGLVLQAVWSRREA
jgi:DME family drug/metabolite transporter